MGSTNARAVVVAAARTAIGTARKGTLANVDAVDLAKPVVTAVIDRSGLDPGDFDDFVLAEVWQGGGDLARYVAVDLGLTSIPGMAVNRQCASSLSAIGAAAGQIAAGMSRAVLAGGTESAVDGTGGPQAQTVHHGQVTRRLRRPAGISLSHPPTAEAPALDMSITVAHNCNRAVRTDPALTRTSGLSAATSAPSRRSIPGSFLEEIVPLTVPQADGKHGRLHRRRASAHAGRRWRRWRG